MIAIFSSYPCPPQFILKAYDLARELRSGKDTIIGGFHSPLEKDMLSILLNGDVPVTVCLARRVESYRVPAGLREKISTGQVKLLAPELRPDQNRITLQTVAKRDALILHLCTQVVIVYARPGGKIESLAVHALEKGNKVEALDDPANDHLFQRGVSRLMPATNP